MGVTYNPIFDDRYRPLTIDNLTITPTATVGICIYPGNNDGLARRQAYRRRR